MDQKTSPKAATTLVLVLKVVKKANSPRMSFNPLWHHTVEKALAMAVYKIQKFQKLQANPIRYGDVMFWAVQHVR